MSRIGRKIFAKKAEDAEWNGGEIYEDFFGYVHVKHPKNGSLGLFYDDEFDLPTIVAQNVGINPQGAIQPRKGANIPVANELPGEWQGYGAATILTEEDLGLSAEPRRGGPSAPRNEVACTCESLLHGHLPECPYPRRTA